MGSENKWINELQNLVNKPVYASDGKEIGIISSVQSEKLLSYIRTDHSRQVPYSDIICKGFRKRSCTFE